jgi:CRP/FNR family transcriptional regulator, cyclic AMP receptor protein
VTLKEFEFGAQVKLTLAKSPLSELPPALIEQLLTDSQRLDVPRFSTLYNYRPALVISGLIRIYITSPDGRQATVSYARSSELLGLAGVIAGPPPVSAQVLTDATLLLLNGKTLTRLGQSEPQLGWIFARIVTGRLYETLDTMAVHTFGSLRQRITRCLLDRATCGKETPTLIAAIGQQELADAVGSVRPVVGRILHDLRIEGLIETVKEGIALINPEGLAAETWELAA